MKHGNRNTTNMLYSIDAATESIDLDRFADTGYVILRGCLGDVAPLRATITDMLKSAGIDLSDATTYHTGEKWHLWDSSKANSNSEGAHARLPRAIDLPGLDRLRWHLDAPGPDDERRVSGASRTREVRGKRTTWCGCAARAHGTT